jgi:sulfoacetaldehyde dehydrogenase
MPRSTRGRGAAAPEAPHGVPHAQVAALVRRARIAQRQVAGCTQAQADLLALAAAWAILEPSRNRELAALAVADTGLGNVADKVEKNHRKTLGLLRDLRHARTVGVVADDPATGMAELARPVGVIAAVVPSTNPAATPANKAINALKCLDAIIFAPSPKGWKTCARLVAHIHAELDRVGAPRDLVQLLPHPVTREMTQALMAQADLVLATGSQANVRAAYASGTPALGVGAGNAAVIVDASADLDAAARRIALSKSFDNATSCSAENSAILPAARYGEALQALEAAGGLLLDAAEKARLEAALWPQGRLNPELIAHDAATIAQHIGIRLDGEALPRFLIVEESAWGPGAPFSGEKLCPVLTVYQANGLDEACAIVEGLYAHQGAGHSVGLHTGDESQALVLGRRLPVSRVIVNQPHAMATGGSFENGLPFSLSMGCGTWGRNGFSDNLHWRHFLNTTRVVRPLPAQVPDLDELMRPLFAATARSAVPAP